MEDPWVNAWGDPHKADHPPNPPPTSAWTSSSKFVTDDQADIAIPSWEAESGTIWDDSPDLHSDLWSRDNRTSQLWSTPTLDSITFAKPLSESQPEASPRSPSPQERGTENSGADQDQEAHLTPEAGDFVASQPSTPDSETEEPPSPSLPAPSSPTEVLEGPAKDENALSETSPDPDGFGTFEVAAHDYSRPDPWIASESGFTPMEQTEDWATAWKGSDETMDNKTESLDEWEMAKRQKEIQDQYVPPELLSSILHQFNEFAGACWPDKQPSTTATSYRHGSGELSEVLGINPIAERLIPSDLTLSAPVTFTKTFISKEMIEAIKLTRHHTITRHGPLAVYMSSKGSLSWEAAIKSKRDVTEADVVPTGWRIVPKQNADQAPSIGDIKKKPAGGLLSFFGRKAATVTQTPDSSSPAKSESPGVASPRSSTASPRPSSDTGTSASVATILEPPSSREPAPLPSAATSATTEISNTGKADSSPMTRVQSAEETIQPPSAVSRFFGRFSRTAKAPGSPRNSIALSSDDIEFLSEVVPSASDMEETDQLDVLSEVIRAPPVPAKLPPPLAPPPRLPPPPKPPPSTGSKPITPFSHHSAPQGMSGREFSENPLFDLDFAFSSPQPQTHTPSASQTASVPSSQILTPLPRPPTHSILSPPLPPPLSPVTTNSRSFTPTKSLAAAPPPTDSLFNDDEFSDFQTSPSSTSSAPLMSMDSAFTSFTASISSSAQPSTSFGDFDDALFQDPPQVPEKPQPVIILPPPPPIFPPPSGSPLRPSTPVKSSSPPKQSIHARRTSRQAESHQRTLSLLETAAAKGKWPAPPSPLPNAIPPPSVNLGLNLFDIPGEPGGPISTLIAPMQSGLGAGIGQSIPGLASSPPAAAPSYSSMSNGNSIRISNGTPVKQTTGTLQVPESPPPTLPQSPTRSIPSHSLQPQIQSLPQQWSLPPPPTSKPLPSTFGFVPPHVNNGSTGSRSGTPLLHSPQQPQFKQQLSVPSSFAVLAPAPLGSQSTGSSDKKPGSGGKLSAQDLSFFESL